eukprot:SAG31_NODE_350_length_17241_cov_156.139715_3_plen_607_part_00
MLMVDAVTRRGVGVDSGAHRAERIVVAEDSLESAAIHSQVKATSMSQTISNSALDCADCAGDARAPRPQPKPKPGQKRKAAPFAGTGNKLSSCTGTASFAGPGSTSKTLWAVCDFCGRRVPTNNLPLHMARFHSREAQSLPTSSVADTVRPGAPVSHQSGTAVAGITANRDDHGTGSTMRATASRLQPFEGDRDVDSSEEEELQLAMALSAEIARESTEAGGTALAAPGPAASISDLSSGEGQEPLADSSMVDAVEKGETDKNCKRKRVEMVELLSTDDEAEESFFNDIGNQNRSDAMRQPLTSPSHQQQPRRVHGRALPWSTLADLRATLAAATKRVVADRLRRADTNTGISASTKLRLLIKVVENIVADPTQPTHRKLRHNTVLSKVGPAGLNFLMTLGFINVGDCIEWATAAAGGCAGHSIRVAAQCALQILQVHLAGALANQEANAGMEQRAGLPTASGGLGSTSPPRYRPAFSTQCGQIHLWEEAEVQDAALSWHSGFRALLDSGNGGCTLISQNVAASLGLTNARGVPVGGRRRMITARGVVEGASDQLYTLPLRYRLHGEQGVEMQVEAAVTFANLGCDLLVSAHDIREFQRQGFQLQV